MGRQPRRASGVKALQAIKETSQTNRTKATASKVNYVFIAILKFKCIQLLVWSKLAMSPFLPFDTEISEYFRERYKPASWCQKVLFSWIYNATFSKEKCPWRCHKQCMKYLKLFCLCLIDQYKHQLHYYKTFCSDCMYFRGLFFVAIIHL